MAITHGYEGLLLGTSLQVSKMKRGPSTHDTGAWFALHETLLALPDFHPEVAFMWGNPINRSALRGQDPQIHKLALGRSW
jgi:hypothetical protein